MSESILIDALAASVLHNWCGQWAILPEYGQALFDRVSRLDLSNHIKSNLERDIGSQRVPMAVNSDGVASIDVIGPIQKEASSLGGTSSVMLRRAVSQAASNDTITSIMLRIDSPGGMTAGTHELAMAVADAAKKKPVYAFIDDLGASAAYWVASQASKVLVNPTGKVGSIGTYMAVADYSGAAEKEGVKVHLIKAGEFKGAGTPGTEITDAQLAEWQRLCNEINAFFVAGVQTGRNMSAKQVQELADGRVHVGQKAVDLGLADGVASYEEALIQLSQAATKPKRGLKMSDTISAPKSATIAELKNACPGMSADWYLSQIEASHSIEQANAAYVRELKADAEKAAAEKAELASKLAEAEQAKVKAEAEVAALKSAGNLGNKPVNHSGSTGTELSSDPVAEFNAAVQSLVSSGMSKPEATAKVCRSQPKLREAMVAAVNKN